MKLRTMAIVWLFAISGAEGQAWAQPGPATPGTGQDWLPLIILGLVWLVILVGLLSVKSALADQNWSVADALSESTEVTLTNPAGALPAGTKVTEMRASSSRTIAFVGSIVIMGLFIGFGSVVLYRYAVTGTMPEVDTIIKFLLSGLGLFVPYAVNKVSSIGK